MKHPLKVYKQPAFYTQSNHLESAVLVVAAQIPFNNRRLRVSDRSTALSLTDGQGVHFFKELRYQSST
jgi:hypothetical protein